MTNPAPDNVALYFEVRKLAKAGLGYEDILVKLKLPKTVEFTDWVRRIVFGRKETP
jgi:hypothetical protein